MREQEPPFEDIIRNLQALFESEKEIAHDAHALGLRLDRSGAGQGETRELLRRMEDLLGRVLDNQSALLTQVEALAAERRTVDRLEGLVLRLIARLPLAGMTDGPESGKAPESVN
ncbi:hypothetical protein [Azospirillum sp. sgz302134]